MSIKFPTQAKDIVTYIGTKTNGLKPFHEYEIVQSSIAKHVNDVGAYLQEMVIVNSSNGYCYYFAFYPIDGVKNSNLAYEEAVRNNAGYKPIFHENFVNKNLLREIQVSKIIGK